MASTLITAVDSNLGFTGSSYASGELAAMVDPASALLLPRAAIMSARQLRNLRSVEPNRAAGDISAAFEQSRTRLLDTLISAAVSVGRWRLSALRVLGLTRAISLRVGCVVDIDDVRDAWGNGEA